jgi:hypothetical protein
MTDRERVLDALQTRETVAQLRRHLRMPDERLYAVLVRLEAEGIARVRVDYCEGEPKPVWELMAEAA